MDTAFEIEIQDKYIDEAPEIQLPINFLTFGEIQSDDVRVYIKQDVYKALEKLSASDTGKELGSIVLGEYCQEHEKTHVIISQYIEAKYTDASASTLTFTHETWDYIHAEHEKNCPDKKIIGWQHTHPNYGIFLSNYDMFIQENFFNLPFQIAYVIDPIQNLRGFFQWKNGKVEKLKGYYIYDAPGKPIKIAQTKVAEKGTSVGASSKAKSFLSAGLCAIVILLSIFAIFLGCKYRNQLEMQKVILEELESQREELIAQSETIKEQAVMIAELQNPTQNTDGMTADDWIALLQQHESMIQNHQSILQELKSFVEASPETQNEIKFTLHTVAPGDSLFGICLLYNIDWAKNKDLILTINAITDSDRIFVGQRLLIPIEE